MEINETDPMFIERMKGAFRMHVTLIEPKPPGRHVFSTVKMPRLGLPLLGSVLKKAGHTVTLIYGSGEDIKVSDVLSADVIGISTTTSTSMEAYHIARYARSQGKTVVMGGAHATFMAEEALESCDYVVRGEGDVSFLRLLECLEADQSPCEVPGISFRDNGRVVHNPQPDWADVNQSPMPDLSAIAGIDHMTTYPVMTSRGCPFDCSFCSVTAMFGRGFRCRDLDLVLDELAQYAGKQVFFIDDNFTANPRRAKLLMQEMIRQNRKPKWWCAQVRTDAARDEELLRLMQQSGCGYVFIGMESVNQATLDKYNKKQSVADIEASIRQFHKYGMMVHGMFVLGSDDDTVQTVRETADFAIRNRIDSVQFMVLTPFPGTRTFAEMEAEGRILTKNWSLYDGAHVVFQPRQMTPLQLHQETIRANKRFYAARRIPANLLQSGVRSAEFRAVGYWLARQWERDNIWFQDYLNAACGTADTAASGFRASKSVESFSLRHFKYLSVERLMDMEISEQNGSFFVELRGSLNGFTLKELYKTVHKILPRRCRDLTINIDGVSFASEEVLRRFLQYTNNLATQARSVRIAAPFNNGLNHWLQSVMEKYNFCVPRFEM